MCNRKKMKKWKLKNDQIFKKFLIMKESWKINLGIECTPLTDGLGVVRRAVQAVVPPQFPRVAQLVHQVLIVEKSVHMEGVRRVTVSILKKNKKK